MDLFSFKGRANRLDFWLVSFGLMIVLMLFNLFAGMVLSAILGGISPEATVWAQMIFGVVLVLLFVWPIMAVSVRRAHDRGASGKWFVGFYLASTAINLWSMSLDARGVAMEAPESIITGLLSLLFLGWWLYFIVTLGFLPGKPGPNAYGPPANGKIENYRAPA